MSFHSISLPASRPASVFVTGTDTGVGKTRAACALLHALRRAGLRAVGMKPVAAGADWVLGPEGDGGWVNEDVRQLRAASQLNLAPELTHPYLLPDPVAPQLAARRAGIRISLRHLRDCYDALARQSDAVVVEGAGGFLVPLNDHETSADLAQALGLPVVLVVGLRLGCQNHALLTAEAIATRGLKLAGWVANRIDPEMVLPDENLAALTRLLGGPPLADWPWQPGQSAEALHVNWPPAG